MEETGQAYESWAGLVGEGAPEGWRAKNEAFSERCLEFASEILGALKRFPSDPGARELARQLARASGSVGANAEEAFGAYSRADFRHAMNIARREARESRFWLRLAARQSWIESGAAKKLIGESGQLVAILTAIVKNSQYQEEPHL